MHHVQKDENQRYLSNSEDHLHTIKITVDQVPIRVGFHNLHCICCILLRNIYTEEFRENKDDRLRITQVCFTAEFGLVIDLKNTK